MATDDGRIHDPLIGQIVNGQYEIVEVIGSGGMGSVYRAKQVGFDRSVAFKVLHENAFSDFGTMRRFQAEASVLGTLNHINIVRVIVFGALEESHRPFLVLEFLSGGSLADCISSDRGLELEVCWEVFEQIAAGLSHAHDRNVLHRDIKPGNIMFSSKPDIESRTNLALKIVDFGVAKLMEGQTLQKLTQTGAIIGTPLYMSPEQLRGTTPTAAADVYSVGCLMYECLFGAPPFQGESLVEVATKQISDNVQIPTVTKYGENVPTALRALLFKTLEKDPTRRVQNGKELSQLLRKVRGAPNTVPAELKAALKQYKIRSRRGMKKAAVVAMATISVIASCLALFAWNALQQQTLSQRARVIDDQINKARADMRADAVLIGQSVRKLRSVEHDVDTGGNAELTSSFNDAIAHIVSRIDVKYGGYSTPFDERFKIRPDDALWMYRKAAHLPQIDANSRLRFWSRLCFAAGTLADSGKTESFNDIEEYVAQAPDLWRNVQAPSHPEYDLVNAVNGLVAAGRAKFKQAQTVTDRAQKTKLFEDRLRYDQIAADIFEKYYQQEPPTDIPDLRTYWTILASEYYDALCTGEKHQESLEFAQKMIDPASRWHRFTDDNWWQYQYWVGLSLQHLQRLRESEVAWQQLIAESKKRSEHHTPEYHATVAIASYAQQRGDLKRAIGYANAALTLVEQNRTKQDFPKLLPAFMSDPEAILAIAYRALGQYDEAHRHAVKAIRWLNVDKSEVLRGMVNAKMPRVQREEQELHELLVKNHSLE